MAYAIKTYCTIHFSVYTQYYKQNLNLDYNYNKIELHTKQNQEFSTVSNYNWVFYIFMMQVVIALVATSVTHAIKNGVSLSKTKSSFGSACDETVLLRCMVYFHVWLL